MSDPHDSLLDRAGIGAESARRHVAEALEGADDGELYLEFIQTEGLVFDNGRLKTASYDETQ
ncbi:MAG: metalloprotease TldD, partial [Alphaproteobacteria bacterium]